MAVTGAALRPATRSSERRGWARLAILMLVDLVYFIDKQIFALLALEAELHFTDDLRALDAEETPTDRGVEA